MYILGTTQTVHKETLQYAIKATAVHRESVDQIADTASSTGVFHFPQDKAAEIAVHAARSWLDAHPDTSIRRVVFHVFKDSGRDIYRSILYPPGTE